MFAFLRTLAQRVGAQDATGHVIPADSTSAHIQVWSFGNSSAGRVIPYVIAAHPMVRSAAAARASDRPVVYVQAHATAGDSDGTDALLAIVRDLALATRHASVLDSLTLIVLPNANPDANDPRAPDITHDALRGATPEGAGIVGLLRDWRPQLVLDLGASDDSTSDELALVPTLTPAAPLAAPYADTIVAELRHTLAAAGVPAVTPCATHAIPSPRCDTRADRLTNAVGLINRFGIRVLTPARAPLARRIALSRAVVRAALSYVAEHTTAMSAHALAADTTVAAWGAEPGTGPHIRMRATDTITSKVPFAYIVPGADTATLHALTRHEIRVQRLTTDRPAYIIDRFAIERIDSLRGPADGLALSGEWSRTIATDTLRAGTYVVASSQSRGLLALVLLDPLSDAGLFAWHVYDAKVHAGASYPIARLVY
jgi:hypothetical protein